MAKKLGLYYRCLGDNHLGNACKWNRQCNIDGCNETHHYLLHRPRDSSKAPSNEKDDNMKVESGPGSNTEGDGQQKTYGATRGQETEYVAFRTVPVIVKNGNKRIPVNCLLNEGSDTSYINEVVIEALGLHGAKTEINVKVANDETVTFMSSTFDVGLESTDGHVDTTITVQSSKKICGGMKPVNWIKIKHNWQHLQKEDLLSKTSNWTTSGYSLRSGSSRTNVFNERSSWRAWSTISKALSTRVDSGWKSEWY